MDANSKFGKDVIKDDPNDKMTRNGKLLYDIICEEDLVLVNASDICEGTITRQRTTKQRTEKSVLNYFIIRRKLFEMILKMKIDENRNLVLTKFTSRLQEIQR